MALPRQSWSDVGHYFAALAQLEAAAIEAFTIMEEELIDFRAPADLVRRVARARNDEVRHAQQMSELARQHGASVPEVSIAPRQRRNLRDVAIENVAEGCVRETWGALCAHWQARAASQLEARRVWQRVAVDETEHAELSRDVHHWLWEQLSSDDRGLVAAAKQRAIAELLAEQEREREPAQEVVRWAGVPDRDRASELLRKLAARLWSTQAAI